MNSKNEELEVWKAFIEAIDINTEKASEAFSVRITDIKDDIRITSRTSMEDHKEKIFNSLSGVFTELQPDFIDYHNNVIYYPTTFAINKEGINTLMDIAAENHFEFSDKASFTGEIKHLSSTNLTLNSGNQSIISSTDVYFLTLDEIEEFDQRIAAGAPFTREPQIGAISTVNPGSKYKSRQQERFIIEATELGMQTLVHEDHGSIQINDAFLNKEFYNNSSQKFGFNNSGNQIVVRITQKGLERFRSSENSRNVRFANNDENKFKGHVLPKINEDGILSCRVGPCEDYSELYGEVSLFIKCLLSYFSQEELYIETIISFFKFDLDIERFHYDIGELLAELNVDFNNNKKNISFDFEHPQELNDIVAGLRANDLIHIPGFGNDHKYKVHINKISPLSALQKDLKSIRYIRTSISKDADRLNVFGLSDNVSQIDLIRTNIENLCGEYLGVNTVLEWDSIDHGYLKYFFHFDEKSYIEDTIHKLESIIGEPIEMYPDKLVLGIVKSVNYPDLTIDLNCADTFEVGEKMRLKSVLKGERDKIKRLRDATNSLFGNSGTVDCPNENLRKALVEPESLHSFIEGEITYTNEYKEVYEKVSSDLLSPYINERQKEAVAKCLMAEDLFVVQGPPGTGKSTAIAELIWQHVKSNNHLEQYKILVTSETNMAVDNALDKLRSPNHLLVKPLRFGKDEKLDREGRKFSLEAIIKWKNDEYLLEETLITDDWISMIKSRINDESNPYLELWKEYLNEKDSQLRGVIADVYINNCNVIGATCSSIGMINSENRFTRFFQEYSSVFHAAEFQRLMIEPTKSNYAAIKSKGINFDLVIQDEASKASPPELALPFLYGKKAIVIGDHRQLPPMIDTNDFIENLNFLRGQAREDIEKIRIGNLIRFIKVNRSNFDKSHFEKLFKGIHANLRSTFDTQYRMHPAINETIKQFYKGDFEQGRELECGLPLDRVDSTDLNDKMSRYHGITRQSESHVMWFNVETPEIRKGTSRINIGEAEAVNWILRNLSTTDGYKHFMEHWTEDQPEEKEIGVITFYGGQAALLKKNVPDGIPVRVSPVDRFQGMERNIVIVSLVRSNLMSERENQDPDYDTFPIGGYPTNDSLGFAESPNRLNVALSRAKRLLIIVGNRKHFERKEIYKRVIDTIISHDQCEMWDYNNGNIKKLNNNE
jgi:hypothetical protein